MIEIVGYWIILHKFSFIRSIEIYAMNFHNKKFYLDLLLKEKKNA